MVMMRQAAERLQPDVNVATCPCACAAVAAVLQVRSHPQATRS